MKEGAQAQAKKDNVKLLTASGKTDTRQRQPGDGAREHDDAGRQGHPASSRPTRRPSSRAIKKARDAGVTVIALDTPTEPQDAADALFATDNLKAGGADRPVRGGEGQEEEPHAEDRACSTSRRASRSAQLRHDGFLKGFGIKEGDPQIVGAAPPTSAIRPRARRRWRTCSRRTRTSTSSTRSTSPSGFGGATALKAAGKDPKDFVLVSVDGGCQAIKDGIKPGIIDATSQQYPLKMAALGVEKGAAAARGGEKPTGYVDTGVELITADPVDGVGVQGRGLRRGELLGLTRSTAGPHPRAGRLRASQQRGPT